MKYVLDSRAAIKWVLPEPDTSLFHGSSRSPIIPIPQGGAPCYTQPWKSLKQGHSDERSGTHGR
jgi:hypothetical protein